MVHWVAVTKMQDLASGLVEADMTGPGPLTQPVQIPAGQTLEKSLLSLHLLGGTFLS